MLSPRGEASLSNEQLTTLEIVTRTASALSALGVVVIVATFCCSRHFRNPMHRLIFINAFFNAFDVVCTMLSISGPKAGNSSALCQFQAFLNQMYVPIDRQAPGQSPSTSRDPADKACRTGSRLPTSFGRLPWRSTFSSSSSAAIVPSH